MLILDVGKAVDAGVSSLFGGAGLFRGEKCVVVDPTPRPGWVVVVLPNSLNDTARHTVPQNCVINTTEREEQEGGS